MKVIDADELMEWASSWEWDRRWYPYSNSDDIPIAELKHILDQMGGVDAVPVVRCKDCKYCTEHYDTDGNTPYWTCSEWDSGTDADGFCYLGIKIGAEYEIN